MEHTDYSVQTPGGVISVGKRAEPSDKAPVSIDRDDNTSSYSARVIDSAQRRLSALTNHLSYALGAQVSERAPQIMEEAVAVSATFQKRIGYSIVEGDDGIFVDLAGVLKPWKRYPLFPASVPRTMVEYYLQHCTHELTFDSVPLNHPQGRVAYCNFCCTPVAKRRFAQLGLGLLSDLFDYPHHGVRRVANLFRHSFDIAAKRQMDLLVPEFHHYNVSLFHVQIIDPHYLAILGKELAHFHFAIYPGCPDDRNYLRYLEFTVKGGMDSEKKQEKKEIIKDTKHRPNRNARRSRNNKNKGGKPQEAPLATEEPKLPAPQSSPSADDFLGEDLGPVPKCVAPPPLPPVNKPAAKKNGARQQQNSKAGRSGFRGAQVERAVGEMAAAASGNRDAAAEIRDLKLQAERDTIKQEKEEKEALALHKAKLNGDVLKSSSLVSETFVARPVYNVGVQCKRSIFSLVALLMMKHWFSSLIVPCIAASLISAKIPLLRLIPSLVRPIFVSAPVCFSWLLLLLRAEWGKAKFAGKRVHFRATFGNEITSNTRLDTDGDIVDTRPSEVKIGKIEMEQTIQEATVRTPLVVSSVPLDESAVGGALVHVKRDEAFERELFTYDFSLLKSIKKFCTPPPEVTYWAPVASDFLRFIPPVITKFENYLRDTTIKFFTSKRDVAILPLNRGVDHSFVVMKNGEIDRSLTVFAARLSALGSQADYNGDACGYVASFDAETVARPTFNAMHLEGESKVYCSHTQTIPFCTHSYHNAATYGAMSSQVSAESNYAMLYRKLSRYTAIGQDRFGDKELVTNAEHLARMKFWAVRETPLARAAASNF